MSWVEYIFVLHMVVILILNLQTANGQAYHFSNGWLPGKRAQYGKTTNFSPFGIEDSNLKTHRSTRTHTKPKWVGSFGHPLPRVSRTDLPARSRDFFVQRMPDIDLRQRLQEEGKGANN